MRIHLRLFRHGIARPEAENYTFPSECSHTNFKITDSNGEKQHADKHRNSVQPFGISISFPQPKQCAMSTNI